MNSIPLDTPAFTEDALSQLPALHLLQKMGWTLLTPSEALALRGGRLSEVVLRPILEKQLTAINSFEYRGQEHAFDRSAVEEGIRALLNQDDDGLVRTNEKVWELLRYGKAVPQTVDGDTKSFTLQYVDWKHPERNAFHVLDEFSVESFGATSTRRPDIVLFVNGIPFVVIECKRSGDAGGGGGDPLELAIGQQLQNQREGEIPKLFHFAQVLLALAVNQAKYGATGSTLPYWQQWRERDPQEDAVIKLLTTPLTEEEGKRTFAPDTGRFSGSTTAIARRWLEALVGSGRMPTEQDLLLHALMNPKRLLSLASRYTVFEGGERRVGRYQQVFAVEDVLKGVETPEADGRRKGGLIWHTQGSGKSLTMVMLAEALLGDLAAVSPKVVLVTDRVDLDDQIYGTFVKSGVGASQAQTGRHLLQLLTSPRTEVVTTLLQKFEAAVNAQGTVLDSPNIFVLVDEGHRSQGGSFHAAMRRVLPNACLVGFTGTPVFKSQTPTIERFGGLIGDAYTIDQAVKDKAVVPLLYEGRHVEQYVDKGAIDEWFRRSTTGLTDEQRADLKRKYSVAEQLNRTDQKIRAIAWDVGEHFERNFKGIGFKGQLVAPSKAAAIRYKQYLDEFGKVSSEVLISPPDTREGNDDAEEGEGRGKRAVQTFWERMMKRFQTETRYQKDLTTRFKSADDPEIIIVVDKLLTGFDAPRNAVLYLTRSLKDHTLLQAIARVNRVYPGKDAGLIVDYYGILQHLNEALELYTDAAQDFEAHLREVLQPLEGAVRDLPQRHSDVWEVFKSVSNKHDREAMERHLEPQSERDRFYERLAEFAKTLKFAVASVAFYEQTPADRIDRYRRDLKYFMELRESVARRYAERVDFKQLQGPIQKLLDTFVGAGLVQTLVEPVSIFDKEAFAHEVEAAGDPGAMAELIANRVRKAIHEHMDEDPVFYTRFSELIKKAIEDAQAKRMTQLELLGTMRDLSDRVRDRRAFDDSPKILRGKENARVYFDVAKERLKAPSPALSDAELAELALRVDAIVTAKRRVDWSEDVDVQNQMKIAIEDELFALGKAHSIRLDFDVIDQLLDRLIDIARRRVP
jgi:type I restriction enzyme, R subunit